MPKSSRSGFEGPRGARKSGFERLWESGFEKSGSQASQTSGPQRNPAEPSGNQPRPEESQREKSILVALNVLDLLYLSIYLSNLSIYLPIYLSIIYLSIYLSTYLLTLCRRRSNTIHQKVSDPRDWRCSRSVANHRKPADLTGTQPHHEKG